MATNSISFPRMFDVSRNNTSVAQDNQSIVNRVRLLILTEPTELYNNPGFGVGLKRHLWKYNTDNEKAIFKKRLIEQLRLYEPCVDADKTTVTDGLLFTGSGDNTSAQEYNKMKLTVTVFTIFGDTLEVNLDE